ncbi:Glu/Leu/Phe/Val dehydrogenase [Limibaculum sp. M0105]|uniref:Glu/Leu/Phe/Val dehydrogenase n=1 Tax=Thermohalobaculum xanthum TaxID=2753746 RepID=A0A8J7SHZ7_9RHOB|nr:Glu/Leu/Phe/Val dehydrogenase dimerization domain-containing protein [Thermohalobaculum xanthum]MBK0400025.1 Glu/Leu/Phe/Val dehydrogenase [Thermohalobaculum xanthum]
MDTFTHHDFDDHEQVVFAHDAETGLRAIIAVHDTTLGPALGGCRIWSYASEGEALTDVLRLSRGMSFKAALADLPLGGGKSVMMVGPDRPKTPAMMRAMGRAVERLAGRYIVAEDVGATVADMDEIATQTRHVSGLSGSVGDPSPWTARGVFLSLEAAVRHRLQRGLDGLRVTVTGLGNVGASLVAQLVDAGVEVSVADIRPEAVEAALARGAARSVEPSAAHRVAADVFAPCALGAVLNATTIPELAAQIVCGAANNQLATVADGERLRRRGILYAPDYLVNAGGLISVARPSTKLSDAEATARLEAIPETLLEIFAKAEAEQISPDAAADRVARARIAKGVRKATAA